ncbi:cysteinyl leukotriene receptor 2 [Trichomycterus rosablanca]|uniref:cysteinyl leukotriene receptor 2 n=1 Tax=Trichomycterus rosablanca TaxID=2290929 RepID=UPI002F3541B6
MGSDNCSIIDFKQAVFPAAYLLIFILGIVGHSISLFILFGVWRKKKSLTTVNLFMVNLLVSDLMLICSLPLRASYFLSGSNWQFGKLACSLLFYVFYLNMYTSIFFLMSLVIMRYLALAHPYRFMSLQKCCNRWTVCIFIWLLTASMCSPLLAIRSGDNEATSKCLELPSNTSSIDHFIRINYATLPFFVAPLTVILLCSVLIAHRLLRPGLSQHTISTSRKKAFALIIISLAFFLICFLPYHVGRVVFLHAESYVSNGTGPESCGYIRAVRKSAVVTLCLCTAHSCLDPILFFFVGENFRTCLTKLLWRKKADDSIRCQEEAELRNQEKIERDT